MAIFVLDSLVLCGCVRLDVVALGLRRDAGAVALGQTNPGKPDSNINPMPGTTTTEYEPDAGPTASGALPGAGRSRRFSGVGVHRSFASRQWPCSRGASTSPVATVAPAATRSGVVG